MHAPGHTDGHARADAKRAAEADLPAEFGTLDLLLVENDGRIAELLAWFLKKRGHAVRRAVSFSEAREQIAVRAPDLMLSDLDLGEESGVDELPRMSAEGVLPPTLIVSGYLGGDVEAVLSTVPGIVGTVKKPFEFSTLEARLDDVLARGLVTPSGPAAAPQSE